MSSSHAAAALSTPNPHSAIDRLSRFIERHRASTTPSGDFAAFEVEATALFAAAQAELVGEEMMRHDVDVPVVFIDGVAHHRRLRSPSTYLTSAGSISVERTLYSTREDGARCEVPMELRCGIVAGLFTPDAARIAAVAHAHLTPGEAERLFEQVGRMQPSRSTLDRFAKVLSETWEGKRLEFEQALNDTLAVPERAVSVAISIDGVMAPMRDGKRSEKRENARKAGKKTQGPAGYQEVGCATLSFFDAEGERLSSVQMARMPENKKCTLKGMLSATLTQALALRPDLTLVKVADGAKDNWTWLDGSTLPKGESVLDFYHAAEHLAEAIQAVHGENSKEYRTTFESLRHKLRHETDGVERVIRALARLAKLHPRKKNLTKELAYFRANRHRMRYAELAARHLTIGSGIVEAACKTLVTQRLKRSGMRWRQPGGQAALTLRALVHSRQFDLAWSMLAAQWTRVVEVPGNVIPWPGRVAG